MTVWSGLVSRQEVGINWWVIRNPTQADPTFQVGWEVRQRTNFTTFNFDGEARWWGQSGDGHSRRRLSGSQEMVHGSGVMSFAAVYGHEQGFAIGAESRTWSNSGGSAATGWARFQRNGSIPRRPTGNPNAPGTPGTSGLTSSAVTLTWAASGDMRGTSFVRYEWQVLNAAGAVLRSGNTTGRSVAVTGLAHTTGFQARVRVVGNGWDAAGRVSPWSAARPFSTLTVAPGQPTNVRGTRISDTQQRVDWTRSTAAGTAQGHDIQTSINGAAWIDAWSVGNVASHTGAFAANRRQTFRVRPWNTISGNRAHGPWSAASAPIFSTPAAPGSVTAQREGANIRVGWRNLVAFTEYRTEIQRGTVGAGGAISWVAGTVNVAAGGVSHVFTGLNPTHQHVFRVRAANLTGGLASGWVQSPAVQLTTVPLAPTMVVPPDAVRADEPFTLAWAHNPADGSAQTSFAVQWSADGFQTEAGSSGRVFTSAHTHTFPAGTFTAGQQLAFRVVTWGAHTAGGGDGTGRSPWSAGVPTRFVAPGVVAFVSPVNGATATEAALSVTLSFTQAQGGTAVAAEVELSRSGVVVETAAATSLAGIPFTYRLGNGADYTLRARVRDTFGFWSGWASIAFAVDFPLPIAADVGAAFLPDVGAAQVAVSLRGTPGEVVRTNLLPTPIGSGATSTDGWAVSAGETQQLVTDEDGQPALEVLGRLARPDWTVTAADGLSELGVIAVGCEVLPLDDDTAATMTLRLAGEGGTLLDDAPESVKALPVPAGQWRRVVHSAVVTDLPAGGGASVALVLDDGPERRPAGFRHRRWVVATAATNEAAEEAVADFFDGDAQADVWTNRAWTGTPHASASVETFRGAPAFVTVVRDAGDGPEVLLERLPWDGSAPLNLLDATPTLNGSNRYEVETITADGAASVGEAFGLRTQGGRLAFLNTGGGMEHVLPMRGAVEVSRTAGRVSEVVAMAERTRPVTLYGANESLVLSVEVDELSVDGDRARVVERFMRTAGRTCYRDPSGLRTFGRVSGGLTGWRGRQARLSFELVESA